MTPEGPMTTAEVAELLGYTPRHVARLAAAGELPATNLPGGRSGVYVYDREHIEALAAVRNEASKP